VIHATEADATVDTSPARTTWLAGLRVVSMTGSIQPQVADRVLAQMGSEKVEFFASDATASKPASGVRSSSWWTG
jgi:hypothetical protein